MQLQASQKKQTLIIKTPNLVIKIKKVAAPHWAQPPLDVYYCLSFYHANCSPVDRYHSVPSCGPSKFW